MLPSGTSYTDSNLLSISRVPPSGHCATVEIKSSSALLTTVRVLPSLITRSTSISEGMSVARLILSAAWLNQRLSCWR
ncbi:hypothetical protein D3C85_1066310 [compost metagenome]